MDIEKHADRVLRSYKGFKRLAELSDEPFSKHGESLVREIERVLDSLPELYGTILVNRYMVIAKDRKSRKEFCRCHGLTVDQYREAREEALEMFARKYRGGALFDLVDQEDWKTVRHSGC
ncbi:hypothetical protein HZZ02_07510 [Streptococcus danieliae]|nr:hypothetical protein [Streptococcus danieliae]